MARFRKLKRILRPLVAGLYWSFAGVALLLLLAVGATQIDWVQRRSAKWVQGWLSSRFGLHVSAERVSLNLPLGATLHEAVVYDLQGDTLIDARELSTTLRYVGGMGTRISLGHTRWIDGSIHLLSDSTGGLRLLQVLALFKRKTPPPKKKHIHLSISSIDLQNVRFQMRRPGFTDPVGRVDYKHFDLRRIHGHVRYLSVATDTVRMQIEGLQFVDRSGFTLRELSSRFSLSPHSLHFDDLHVASDDSDLHLPTLRFSYNGWRDLPHFVDSVHIQADVSPSKLHTHTLAYFVPLPRASGLPTMLSGRVQGRVSDFQVDNLNLFAADSTSIHLNASLVGLPDMHASVLNVEIDRMQTCLRDVEHIVSRMTQGSLHLPQPLRQVSRLEYRGNLVGFMDDFVAYGTINSGLGQVQMDLGLSIDSARTLRFNGQIHTHELHLDELLRDTTWGRLSMVAHVDGELARGGRFRSQLESQVHSIDILGHRYHEIDLKGFATNRSYSGSLKVNDSALQLGFNGVVDFTGSLPVFRFNASLPHADLHAMNLHRSDTISRLALHLDAYMQGGKLDELDGTFVLHSARYRNSRGTVRMGTLMLEASGEGGRRIIELQSEPLRCRIEGGRRYDQLWPSLKAMAFRLMPMLGTAPPPEPLPPAGANSSTAVADASAGYRVKLVTGNLDTMFRVLLPQMHVAEATALEGYFAPSDRVMDFALRCDSVRYGAFAMRGGKLLARVDDSVAQLALAVQGAALGTGRVQRLAFDVDAHPGRFESSLTAYAPDYADARLHLHAVTHIERQDSTQAYYAVTRLDSSQFDLAGGRWLFSRARVYIDSASVSISNFQLRNERQRFSLAGRISRNPTDSLRLSFDDFNLSNLSPLLGENTLGGRGRGEITLASALQSPSVKAQVTVSDLRLNELYVGSPSLEGYWRGSDNPVSINLSNTALDGHQDIRARIAWAAGQKDLVGELQLDQFDLSPLHVLTGGHVQPRGTLTGSLAMRGSLAKPRIEGQITCDRAGAYIKELNTEYTTSSTIHFAGGQMRFNRFVIQDAQGAQMTLNGSVDYSNSQRLQMDVRAVSDNLHLLNTNTFGQGIYYGQLMAAAEVHATGDPSSINLSVQLRTSPGTALTLQFPSSEEARENRHLQFVSPAKSTSSVDTTLRVVRIPISSRLHLAMGLQVDSESQVQIVLNPRTGDAIRARGDADLRITSDPRRQMLQVYGDYTLQRGEVQFTLEGLISKRFRIAQGSTIHFAGDVAQAHANIETVYRTRASLDRLLGGSDQDKYKRRIPVDCKLFIRGSLAAPTISFAIDVPQADAETRSQLSAALNTEEKKMRQFAALLVLNTFLSDGRSQTQVTPSSRPGSNDAGGVRGEEVILSSFGELLSNQFNSWLAQIGQSDDAPSFNLGFNYRPNAQQVRGTRDEAEVSLSMQWKSFNVDANWEVNKNNTSNAVAGDINITKQSTWLKNLQYKAFARSNDDLIFSDLKPYTAGIGLVYSDSYDNWSELFRRILSIFRRKKKEPKPVEEEQAP